MDSTQGGNRNANRSDAGGRTPGAAGHPEPGSQHDDSKLETVDDGPDTPIVDGEPGADGDVGTTGGAISQTNQEGKAADIDR